MLGEEKVIKTKQKRYRYGFLFLIILFLTAVPIQTIPGFHIQAQAAKVKISKKKVTLIKGQKYKLKLKGAKGKIKWSSSKKTVAVVNKSGKVTAKKKGTAVIKAKYKKKTYKCTVKVEEPKLNITSATINLGETIKLNLTGTTKHVEWVTDDTEIALPDNYGNIKGVGVGTTKVYAAIGWTFFYSCQVTVRKPKADQPKGYIEYGKQISAEIDSLLSDLTDDNGYTLPGQSEPAATRVIEYAKQLQKEGKIQKYYYNEDWDTVSLVFPDGGIMAYEPLYEGTLAGDDQKDIFKVFAVDNAEQSYDALDIFTANSCASVIDNLDEYCKENIPYKNSTLDNILKLLQSADQYRVIFWRGHGIAPICIKELPDGSKIKAAGFVLHEDADKTVPEWKEEYTSNRIITTTHGSIVIMPSFIEKYMTQTDGGLFYSGTCYGGADGGSMAQAILDKGIDVYIGATGSVLMSYSCDLMMNVALNLMSKRADGNYVTADFAMSEAKKLLMDKDYWDPNVTFSLFQKKANSFRLVPKKYTVVCKVLDEKTNDPLKDVSVTIENTTFGWAADVSGYTLENGMIELQDIYAGELAISLDKDGYISKQYTVHTSDLDTADESILTLDDYSLKEEVSFSGTILDDRNSLPIEGATVEIKINGTTHTKYTDENGFFSFKKLTEGIADVRVIKKHYETVEFSTLDKITGYYILDTIRMKHCKSKITGTIVTKSDGTAVSGVSITIQNESDSALSYTTTTDGTGSYSIEFDSVDAAYWKVTASKKGYEASDTRVFVMDNSVTAPTLILSKSDVVEMDIWDGTIAEVYHGGTGTQSDPYQIANGAELALLAEQVNSGDNKSNVYFTLTEDIYLNDVSNHKEIAFQGDLYWMERWNIPSDALKWIPIGIRGDDQAPFSGIFDGGGHTIFGIYIWPQTEEEWAAASNGTGLFGLVKNGTVKNLVVKDSLVSGDMFVGGICGLVITGTISNCTHTGDARGSQYVGGIAGGAQSSSQITNCSQLTKAGLVSGGSDVGGIVGNLYDSTLSECTYDAYMLGSGTPCGGIVGYMAGSNCRVTGNDSSAILYYIGTDKVRLGSVVGMKYQGTVSNNSVSNFICYTNINGSNKTTYSCNLVGSSQ